MARPDTTHPYALMLVTVTAPSRLHFGLMNFGGGGARQYGGVGAMIDRPGTVVRVRTSDRLCVSGPLADRAESFARRWQAYHGLSDELGCSLEVVSVPREHTGLGVGTQLALAVAHALNHCFGLPPQSPVELATSVGRGLRSAVGAYGFLLGGLIVERGKLPGEPISPLDARLDLPADWRWVLVTPLGQSGLASVAEVQAFATLPAVPAETSAELARIAREELLPGAATGDLDRFAESVYRYGHLSGECFAALQGGPYNGPELTRLVELLRSLGATGVGQSSWGPTIFALQPDQAAAEQLVARLRANLPSEATEITIAATCNRGASVIISNL